MPLEPPVVTQELLKYSKGYYINLLTNIDLFIKRAEKEDLLKFIHIIYETKNLNTIIKSKVLEVMEALTDCLFYMKENKELHITKETYSSYLILDNLIKLFKRRDIPSGAKTKLKLFLHGLPSYQENAPKQNDTVLESFSFYGRAIEQFFNEIPVAALLKNKEIIVLLNKLNYEQLDSEESLYKKEVNVVHTINKIKYLNSLTASEEKELFEKVKSLKLTTYGNKYLEVLKNLVHSVEIKDKERFLDSMEQYVNQYCHQEDKSSGNLSLHDYLIIFSTDYFETQYNYTKGSLIQYLLKKYDKELFFSFMEKYDLPFNMPLIHNSKDVENAIDNNTDTITKAFVFEGPNLHQYAAKQKISLVNDLKEAGIKVWDSFEYNAVEKNNFYNYKCIPLMQNNKIYSLTQDDMHYMIINETIDEHIQFMNKYDDKAENIFETLVINHYFYAFIELYNKCKSKNPQFNIFQSITLANNDMNIFELYYKNTNTNLRHKEIYDILTGDYLALSQEEKEKLAINPIDELYNVDSKYITDVSLAADEVINEALLLEPFLTQELIGKVVIQEDFTIEDKASENNEDNYLVQWYNKSQLGSYMTQSGGRKVDLMNKILNSCPNKKPLLRVNDESFFDQLEQNLPNFKEVINYYKGQFRQNRYGDKKRINPVLLLGPPGIGKTYFSKKLAEYLKTGYHFIDMGGLSASWVLSGMNGTWQDAKQGKILDIMMANETFNPVVLLDEVDKISSNAKYDPSVILHQLLEEVNAKEFIDEYIDFSFDVSGIIYIACANTAVTLSDPLLSRFKVFTVANPDHDQLDAIINNIYYEAAKDNKLLNKSIDSHLLNNLKGNSLREVKGLIEEAITNALLEYSLEQLDNMKANGEMFSLTEKHFKNKYERSKFGF